MTLGFDSTVDRQSEIISRNNELRWITENAACQMHLQLCQRLFESFHHRLQMSNKAWDFKWSWVWHMAWTDDGTYAVPSRAGGSAVKSEGELKWCRTLSDWRSERAMIKTIKPNLASKLCCINKHGPRSFDYPGTKTHCETGLFLTTFVLKSYLSRGW